MVVCVCNNVSTNTINNDYIDKNKSVDDLIIDTGATTCCGKCANYINCMFSEKVLLVCTENSCISGEI